MKKNNAIQAKSSTNLKALQTLRVTSQLLVVFSCIFNVIVWQQQTTKPPVLIHIICVDNCTSEHLGFICWQKVFHLENCMSSIINYCYSKDLPLQATEVPLLDEQGGNSLNSPRSSQFFTFFYSGSFHFFLLPLWFSLSLAYSHYFWLKFSWQGIKTQVQFKAWIQSLIS